jgi:O-antigen/teichoic acid export membrane protein
MSGSSVGRNAAWLMASTALNKLIAFVTFALVAKYVGPTVTGAYFFGVSVTSVFVIFSDLGMTPVVIRAISGSREDGERLLGAAMRLKLFLIPVAVVGSLAYVVLTKQTDPAIIWTVAVACAVMSADAVHLVLYGALRGRHNLQPESIGMLIGQILTAIGSIVAARFGYGAVGLATALFAGSAWNVIWATIQSRRFHIVLLAPHASDYRKLFIEALPFGISGIAVKLYSYVDTWTIQAYQGSTAVGMYAVAYKMTYALQFLPLTFTAALYPALAKQWAEKKHDELKQTFLGSMRFMAVIAFPMSAGLSALAPRIIPLVYGHKFDGAIAPFVVLPWVLLPIFLDFPVGSLLNATHRAHLKTTAMVITMIINVVMNLILVPMYGPVGAAWSGVVSFWALMMIGFVFSSKDTGWWPLLSVLFRSSAAAAISYVVWHIGDAAMPFLANAAFGSAIAILLAFVFQLVTVEDAMRILRLRKPTLPDESIHADV